MLDFDALADRAAEFMQVTLDRVAQEERITDPRAHEIGLLLAGWSKRERRMVLHAFEQPKRGAGIITTRDAPNYFGPLPPDCAGARRAPLTRSSTST